jgi:hypothetical protein
MSLFRRTTTKEDHFLEAGTNHDGKEDCPECAYHKQYMNKKCQLAYRLQTKDQVELEALYEDIQGQYNALKANMPSYNLRMLRRDVDILSALIHKFYNYCLHYREEVIWNFRNQELIDYLCADTSQWNYRVNRIDMELRTMKKNDQYIAGFWVRTNIHLYAMFAITLFGLVVMLGHVIWMLFY